MKLLLSTVFILIGFAANSQVLINELFADNSNHVYDPETEQFPDYIELYNAGDIAVDLSGYGLSDNPQSLQKWRFPSGTTIASHSFLLVWADGNGQGLHANFKLDKDGEAVLLSDASGMLLDNVDFAEQQTNISFGRKPDGTNNWKLFQQPTPEQKNVSPELVSVPDMLQANLQSGFYAGTQTLTFTSKNDNEIHYTLNGEEPTSQSSLYSGSIEISKTTVCRAACFIGSDKGVTLTISLFINERDFDIPVVSISTDPDNFFGDETGIYVKGTNGIANVCSDEPVNWNQDWERPVYFEYFSPEGTPLVQSNAQTRIMGGCSRIFAQKSLTIVAENEPFQYPFFKDREAKSYKSIVLRNSGNDWGGRTEGDFYAGTMMRDAYIQSIVKGQMDIDYQAYQPVAVFLNGAYWGLHNMREHLNEDYIKNNHPRVDEDNLDLIKNHWDIKEGDRNERLKLETFLNEHDLSIPENYQHVSEMVDVDEYINYQLTEIFLSNDDWPGNNVRFWRERTPNGKWRFILYDLDYGFGIWDRDVRENNLAKSLDADGPFWPNPPYSTLLFRKLMENEGFKNTFIQRMSVQLDNCFSDYRIDSVLTALKSGIRAEMPYHLQRWYAYLNTPEEWEQRTDLMGSWAKERRTVMATMLKDYFVLEEQVSITFAENIDRSATIWVAGTLLNSANQTVRVFPKLPISISVQPKDGYLFSHWEDAEGNIISTHLSVTIAPENTASFVAVMDARPPVTGLIINEVLASNKGVVLNGNEATPDYIEIHNNGTDTINLSGLYLTDRPEDLLYYQLPHATSAMKIAPGQYKLFWADGAPERGADHVGFKLSQAGGTIVLSSAMNGAVTILDRMLYTEQLENVSVGRFPKGSSNAVAMYPTPAEENTGMHTVAKLRQLSVSNFPLAPAFHPDSLSYTVAVPSLFISHRNCTAQAYGNASVTKDSSLTGYIVTVYSTDETTQTHYNISVGGYEPVSTFIQTVTLSEGRVFSDFHKTKTVHTVITGSETVPEIQWTLEDDRATAEYFPATSFSDTSKIIVRAPHAKVMEYCFVFSTSFPHVDGLTYNMSYQPEFWYVPSSSYSSSFKDGKATIDINKTKPWDGITLDFGGIRVDFTGYPYIELGISSTDDCTLQIDLQTSDGTSTNGGAVAVDIKGGKSKAYLFTYIYKFWQSVPSFSWVDSSQIDNMWMCFDPGEVGLNSQITIDYIKIGSHVIFETNESFDAEIHITSGTLHPSFDEKVFDYSVINFEGIPQLFVTTKGQEAVVDIANFSELTNNAQVVISEYGMEDVVYNFTLKPDGLSSNALLSNLWVPDAELSPTFNPDDTVYTTIEYNSDLYRVFAEAEDLFAEVTIIQAPSIYQKSYIKVTAEDGTQKTYLVEYALPEIVTSQQSQTAVLSVFPNPACEFISFSGSGVANLDLYDQSGRHMFSHPNTPPETAVLLPALPTGLYFVKIQSGTEQQVFSVWIQP